MAKRKQAAVTAVAHVLGVDAQPVAKVEWVRRELLYANDYNPNHVAVIELDLLELSILEDGWTQPIVTQSPEDDGRRQVVDGFHRWTVSGRPSLLAMTGGLVPVVTLVRDRASQMLATIRHNRARGLHGVMPMARIVRSLLEEHGMTKAEVGRRLGMEDEEVERLADHAGVPEKVARDTQEFGKAWSPTRDKGSP